MSAGDGLAVSSAHKPWLGGHFIYLLLAIFDFVAASGGFHVGTTAVFEGIVALLATRSRREATGFK